MNTLAIIAQKCHSYGVNSHGLNTLRSTSCRSRLSKEIPANLMIPIGRHLGGGVPCKRKRGCDLLRFQVPIARKCHFSGVKLPLDQYFAINLLALNTLQGNSS